MNSDLALVLPDARMLAATYALLDQGKLEPELPSDFPRLPGLEFFAHLTAANHLLFFKEEKTFMGLAGATPEEDVLAILGTHTGLQWWLDAQFASRPWTTVDGATGIVEHGFSEVYEGITLTNSGMPLRDFVAKQGRNRRPLRIICHSLGAAVGGIAAGDAYKPRLRMFAMPKFSDLGISRHVASKATDDSVVSRNVQDVVPISPPFPIYQSVLPEAYFNSDVFGIPGTDAARHNMVGSYLMASIRAAADVHVVPPQ